MQSIIHADIFFFVSTIAVVILALLALVVLVYLIVILRNLKEISERAKEEGFAILDDVAGFRHFVKEKSHNVGSLFKLFSFVHSRARKKNKKDVE